MTLTNGEGHQNLSIEIEIAITDLRQKKKKKKKKNGVQIFPPLKVPYKMANKDVDTLCVCCLHWMK